MRSLNLNEFKVAPPPDDMRQALYQLASFHLPLLIVNLYHRHVHHYVRVA
jgi:hypothetical protein